MTPGGAGATVRSWILAVLVGGLLPATPARAAVSADEAARLGETLTPLGAEAAGNADGSIPPWTGGITQPPAGYQVGTHHPDPFAADPRLLSITAGDAERHAALLSPGQRALFAAYPETFRMHVYPSRRSASYPPWLYAETIANATRARLTPNGTGVTGARAGFPFPVPRSGLEVLWNHNLRFRGTSLDRVAGQVMPTASGDYKLVKIHEQAYFFFNRPGSEPHRHLFYFRAQTLAPGSLAGNAALLHEPFDYGDSQRTAWIYVRGERRVRRTGAVAYDMPGTAADGLRTSDDYDMFNGSPEQYDWELTGKRELYIPYNSYRLHSDRLRHKDIVQPGHINPEHVRYEKHRVWVIEGTLKPGASHVYARRVYYLDEDSWQISAAELYDHDDELWRVGLAYGLNYYEVPVHWSTLEVFHDLRSGRYIATGLDNEFEMTRFDTDLDPGDFTPMALRRLGRR